MLPPSFFPVAAEDVFIPDETYRALSRLTGFDSLFRPAGKRAVAGVWLECAPKSVALKERLSDEMKNGSLKGRFTYHPVNAGRLMSDTSPDSAQMWFLRNCPVVCVIDPENQKLSRPPVTDDYTAAEAVMFLEDLP